MTILNNASDGLHPELIVLFRAVAYSKSITKNDLINFCSPVKDEPEDTERLKGALGLWERLGLFTLDQDKIEISPNIFPKKNKRSFDELTTTLPLVARQLLLRGENCLPLWDDTSDNERGNGTSADFVRALSWVLAQDIYNFPTTWDGEVENLASSQTLYGKKVFQGGFRFNAFRHWSRYLGFAAGDGRAFKVDPTSAIRESFPAIFQNEKEMSAHDFLRGLSTQLPVLDTGSFRKIVEENLNPDRWRKPDSGYLSMSLSFALKRLEMSKDIRLVGRADSGVSFRLTGHNYRTWGGFESVTWSGGLS